MLSNKGPHDGFPTSASKHLTTLTSPKYPSCEPRRFSSYVQMIRACINNSLVGKLHTYVHNIYIYINIHVLFRGGRLGLASRKTRRTSTILRGVPHCDNYPQSFRFAVLGLQSPALRLAGTFCISGRSLSPCVPPISGMFLHAVLVPTPRKHQTCFFPRGEKQWSRRFADAGAITCASPSLASHFLNDHLSVAQTWALSGTPRSSTFGCTLCSRD